MSRKVPVIMQMEALECGAACLCMISSYYGKWVPLPKVRKDCGVSRDGSVAKNILVAARKYGFEASGYKMEPSDIGEMPLPAIIHWNFNHFVVLTKIDYKKKKVHLNDPARGRVVVSLDEFDNSFTGIFLSVVPSKNFKPEGKQDSLFTFMKSCLKNSLFPFFLASLMSIALGLINIVYPLFNRVFIDNILTGKESGWLPWFVFSLICVMIMNVLVGIIQSIHWLKIEGKFAIVSSAKFMWHCIRLPLEFFSQRYIGDIVSRQESTASISLVFIKKLAPMFIDLFSLILYLFFMIKYSWKLTIIGISVTVLNIFIVKFISQRMAEIRKSSLPNAGKLMSVTYSAVEMIETIKSTGAENGFFERWAGFYAKQNNANISIFNFSQYISSIPSIIQTISGLVIQMLGILLIIKGEFTIGILSAFQGFLSGFRKPVDNFLDAYQSFIGIKNEIDRVEDVLDYKLDVSSSSDSVKNSNEFLDGTLELKNITFGYSPLAKPIIKDFSMKIEPGQWVALVGGSGSGKSTISKLIMGLYQPWSGDILFNGKKKTEIDPYVFYNHVSMVDQERTLFNDTIKSNIKMWDNSIEDFSTFIAAREAEIHKTIISREGGYNHLVREGGKDFSGGQCQRFELARALAIEPVLLILDEATSALDAQTEEKVIKNIRKIGCACVVIAHRLSTIRDCDNIIVLRSGKIYESGTHDELLKINGFYSKLVSME